MKYFPPVTVWAAFPPTENLESLLWEVSAIPLRKSDTTELNVHVRSTSLSGYDKNCCGTHTFTFLSHFLPR